MSEHHELPSSAPHPLVFIILVLITMFAGFALVGPIIGFFAALPFYSGNVMELVSAVGDPMNYHNPEELEIPLYVIQGFSTFIGFIAGPAILMFIYKWSPASLFRFHPLEIIAFIITPIIVISSNGFNSLLVQWNANVHFPEFLQGFEQWAREKEDLAAEVTNLLTKLETPGELAVAMLVIAALPALGEELVFRGLIQRTLTGYSKNHHLAIWVSAILFSAIHFQFFGFLPRLALGALFGYLYYWSGNLSICVLAHFANNGITVMAMYLQRHNVITYDLETTDALPWQAVIPSTLLAVALIFYFRKYYAQHRAAMNP